MVLAAGRRRLEAGDAVAELDALDEPELDELVERAVDARDPDAAAVARMPSKISCAERQQAWRPRSSTTARRAPPLRAARVSRARERLRSVQVVRAIDG